MKKIMLGLFLTLGLCNAFAQTDITISRTYLENNIAITGSKARIVSKTEYVQEIKLKNYREKSVLPVGFGAESRVYADDGRGYDLIRGDGIFTSKEKYAFKSEDRSNLESNKVVYDANFQYKVDVDNDPELQAKIKFTCKFAKVGCPPVGGGNCPACRNWGWSCWDLQSCDIGFEL